MTDRDLPPAELEADDRRHAVVEQSIAELRGAGLAHLPSGNFMANAAWLALTVGAHNLGRGVAILAGDDLQRATAATLRRKAFTMPGRLVISGRRHLRLPELVPDRRDQHRAEVHPCDPAALLNRTSHPDDQDAERPADRQLSRALPNRQP